MVEIRQTPTPGYRYTVRTGDTLSRISIRAYGVASKFHKIVAVNEIRNQNLIFPDQVIFIPLDDEEVAAEQRILAQPLLGKRKDQVTFVLDGKELQVKQGRFGWGFDVLAWTYNCEVAWTPGKDTWFDNVTGRGKFTSSHLYMGSECVCTGMLYSRENIITPNGMTKTLEFFSVTKDIVDSHIPPTIGGATNRDLKSIAQEILGTRGYPVTFIPDETIDSFPTAEIRRQNVETVAKYFHRLASQRGYFMSCDEHGGVVFQKAVNSGRPIANIEFDGRGANEYRVKFDDTLRYGKYYATGSGNAAGVMSGSATDPDVPAARQLYFEANDSQDMNKAAAWQMLRLELEALSINIPVSSWFDDNGDLWRFNKIVRIKSPVLDIPDWTDYIIRSVEFEWSLSGRLAVLNLVPPLSVDDDGNLVRGVTN